MSVLCLIADPANPVLEAPLARAIQRITGGTINWLAQGIACEIIAPKSTDPETAARELAGGTPIDINLIPAAHRRKRLLVADMDSTLIHQECIDELAGAAGIKDQISAITARTMSGELDFAGSLKTRVALLKGIRRATIQAVRREQITLVPGGRALVQTMKAYGAYTSLVSGGFTVFSDHIGARIGFDEAISNTLEFDGDVLTGTVAPPIIDKQAKRARLLALTAELGITPAQTLAVGDGANDLAMLAAAGLGVALHAKPKVAKAAQVRIDHGDLTALLYLQGYSEEEIVR